MAQDPVQDSFAGDNDPLSDAGAPEPQAGEPTTPESGEVETPTGEGDQGVPGTPFKDQAALIEGYKNIQRLIASKDQALRQMQEQLAALQRPAPQAPKAPDLPKGDDFWKAMSADPVSLIEQIAAQKAQTLFEERYGTKVTQMESQLAGMQRSERINGFLREHPDFSADEEDQMVAILQANPILKELPNGLELAYDSVVASKYRSQSTKQAAGAAVAGAKSVAGLGGKKTTLPAQKQGDIFDDVLELDKSERELFKMGRKS